MKATKGITVFFFLALLLAVAPSAHALKVSTGSDKGTYHSMFLSMQGACDVVSLTAATSSGSDENIERMISKQTDLAFVQTDTLQFAAMGDPRASEDNIKTLLVLHPEEVHVVVKTGLMIGAKFGFGGRPALTIDDLAGRKVGAWGGSYTTARVISVQSNLAMSVQRFEDPSAAKSALDNGQIDAIIAVGGQPLGFVQGLDQNYRLLSITGEAASRLSFYVPAKLNYRKLNAQGVPTVAAQAILVTRNFKVSNRKNEVVQLRECVLRNLDEFKEGSGHHPKWQDVDPDAKSVRAMYAPELAKKKAVRK